jgi:penicillin-binding protein 1A
LDIKRDLIAQGMSEETAIDLIYNGGLRIYTTMDSAIQKVVDTTFTDDTLWPVPYLGLSYREGAMVILDNNNAQVKAMYGGFGEKKSNTLNRATQIERQPGSVMKPIAVYGPALNERLITPATVIDDAPVYMNGIENPLYPMNYDKSYKGLTTVRDAVRYSLNVVAAQVYADILGTEKPLEYLAKVGIVREQQNVSLALGGLDQGISPLQAAGAFLPFANRGIYFQPSTYTRVEDRLGNIVIQKKAADPVLVYDEAAAYVMNSILQSVTDSGTASGTTVVNASGESITTAGKTGTTENNRDHWFVGMTPYYTASTWYGYDNNAEVPQGPEWQQALKLWQIVMRQIHQGLPGKTFAEPQGIVRKEICLRSGKLITSACLEDPLNIATGKPYAPVREEIFIKGTEPKSGDICKVHQVKNVCIESDDGIGRHLIAGPYCPTADLERKVFIERIVPFQQQKADTPFPADWIYSYDPNRTCNVHTGPGITANTPATTPK